MTKKKHTHTTRPDRPVEESSPGVVEEPVPEPEVPSMPSDTPPEEAEAPVETAATPDLAAEYLDQLQRLKAEFDNYRKRVAREKQDWWRQARASAVTQLLPVLDDYRRALRHAGPEAPDGAGLLLILKRFEEGLTRLGLEEMKTEPGTDFDPEVHEALLTSPSGDYPEGQIVETLEPGYLLDGVMLRPGKVAVSSGPASE